MKIQAQSREKVGKKVSSYRKENLIPAVVFGPNRESTNILVNSSDFRKMFPKVGYNVLFDLDISGESTKSLVKDVQRNPLTEGFLHVSFYEIDMKKTIDVEVPIEITGESLAVKNNIGFLEVPLERVSIKCLPANIPSKLTASIDTLLNINDVIHITDVKLPEGVELSSNVTQDTVVARITPPQKELVEETPVTEVAAEGAEGETPAAEGGETTEAKPEEGKSEEKK